MWKNVQTKVKYTVHKKDETQIRRCIQLSDVKKRCRGKKIEVSGMSVSLKKKLCKKTNSRNINIELSKTYNTFYYK